MTEVRLLLIDDAAWEFEILQDTLAELESWRVEAFWCASLDATGAQSLGEFDVLLLDRGCAVEDTILKAIARFRSNGFAGPVVMISNAWTPDLIATALRDGAAECCDKRNLDVPGLTHLLDRAFRVAGGAV